MFITEKRKTQKRWLFSSAAQKEACQCPHAVLALPSSQSLLVSSVLNIETSEKLSVINLCWIETGVWLVCYKMGFTAWCLGTHTRAPWNTKRSVLPRASAGGFSKTHSWFLCRKHPCRTYLSLCSLATPHSSLPSHPTRIAACRRVPCSSVQFWPTGAELNVCHTHMTSVR